MLFLTPPGASAGRKSPKTFLTVDPRGRPYAQRSLDRYPRVGVYGKIKPPIRSFPGGVRNGSHKHNFRVGANKFHR